MGLNNDAKKTPQTSLPKVKSNNYAAFERESELDTELNKESTSVNRTTIHKEHKQVSTSPAMIASNPHINQEKVKQSVFGLGGQKDVSSDVFQKEKESIL